MVAENYSKFLLKKFGKELIDEIVLTGFKIASESEKEYEGE